MSSLLEVSDLESWYGASHVLFGVSFKVAAGECVSLIGRNGMGKTTTVKSIMGMLAPRAGKVSLAGKDITGSLSYRVAQAGIGLVPEGRHVFPNLTVRENLLVTAENRLRRSDPWTMEKIYALFPRLLERERTLAGKLSGGEQQMLAIGRALLTNPMLLILDEATEGLAPLIRDVIWNTLEMLKASGLALIVIDKNIGPMLKLSDRHYIVEKGRVVWGGTSDELRAKPELLHEYVGV